MANQALAAVHAALRARKLDRTLTTALPTAARGDAAATGIARLDAILRGGLPRGELSEIVGARSSGRTTLLLQVVAAATARGERAALVDAFDRPLHAQPGRERDRAERRRRRVREVDRHHAKAARLQHEIERLQSAIEQGLGPP